jgi:hypothetical protein
LVLAGEEGSQPKKAGTSSLGKILFSGVERFVESDNAKRDFDEWTRRQQV